ncbi:MAG: hypothetical protein L0215_14055 [Gemmataceae bacterium]|nr:hypothetical protein [Gemmataceae bacterium]
MAHHALSNLSRPQARLRACGNMRPWMLGLLLAAALPGCVTQQPFMALRPSEPTPVVCQAHAYWEGRVFISQDTENGGAPVPVLAGRLYLFGTEVGHPFKARGKVMVDLLDVTKVTQGAAPVFMDRWELSADTLERLARQDTIGWGYTLTLPWRSYRPDIRHVQLRLCFTPEKGNLIFAPPSTVALRSDAEIPIQSRQDTSALKTQAPTPPSAPTYTRHVITPRNSGPSR